MLIKCRPLDGILPTSSRRLTLIFPRMVVTLVIVLMKKYRKGKLTCHVHASAPTSSRPYLSALKCSREARNGDIDVDEYYARRTALKGPDPAAQA